uniref:Uncharacterized protein n=1 Tax=Anguilla anguilla TaxID=7936 RepID=A0A0E9W1T3_ANGAN
MSFVFAMIMCFLREITLEGRDDQVENVCPLCHEGDNCASCQQEQAVVP